MLLPSSVTLCLQESVVWAKSRETTKLLASQSPLKLTTPATISSIPSSRNSSLAKTSLPPLQLKLPPAAEAETGDHK